MRADVIHTDTKGLNARTASVAVQGGNMPVYFARPSDMANPPVHAAPKNSIDLAPEVKEPVLGLYGEADAGIPPDQVHQMEAALKAAGKTAEFHEYPGAPHGFVADYRASYRQEAAEDGWNRMVGWFKKYKVLS